MGIAFHDLAGAVFASDMFTESGKRYHASKGHEPCAS